MKALVYDDIGVLNYRDAPDPQPGPGDELVRVEAVGICGSDMHGFLGHDSRRVAPLILGHEAAGRIVGGTRDGERVTINPLHPCGTCPACKAGRENICWNRQLLSLPPREGAFAQFVSVPGRNLVTVPKNVTLEQAALAEPIAVSWHAMRLGLAALHPGMDRKALIIGGGAIGLAAALVLRAMDLGDITIVEPNPARATYLRDHCNEVVAPEVQGTFPLVVDAVGYAPTRAVASAHVEPGGVIAHIGLGDGDGGLDIRRMTLQEITFIGTYCYTPQDFRDTAQAIFDGRLGPLDWVEERHLAEGAAAFADIREGRVAAPKVLLHP